MSFLIAGVATIGLLALCVMMFYEILALVWVRLPGLDGRPRTQIFITLGSTLLGHVVAIALFGASSYLLARYTPVGVLQGGGQGLMDYMYFSALSYSSLGIDNVRAIGDLQLLVAMEAILGLVLIGWTITYTYLVTEKFLMHRMKRGARH